MMRARSAIMLAALAGIAILLWSRSSSGDGTEMPELVEAPDGGARGGESAAEASRGSATARDGGEGVSRGGGGPRVDEARSIRLVGRDGRALEARFYFADGEAIVARRARALVVSDTRIEALRARGLLVLSRGYQAIVLGGAQLLSRFEHSACVRLVTAPSQVLRGRVLVSEQRDATQFTVELAKGGSAVRGELAERGYAEDFAATLEINWLRANGPLRNGNRARLGSDGSFALRGLARGRSYRLRFRHTRTNQTWELRAQVGQDELRVTVPEVAQRRVRGRCVDVRGRPIVGARVEFGAFRRARDPSGGFGVHASVRADASGAFDSGLIPSSIRRARLRADACFDVILELPESFSDVELGARTLRRGARVRLARPSDDRAETELSVEALDSAGRPLRVQSSDAQGLTTTTRRAHPWPRGRGSFDVVVERGATAIHVRFAGGARVHRFAPLDLVARESVLELALPRR